MRNQRWSLVLLCTEDGVLLRILQSEIGLWLPVGKNLADFISSSSQCKIGAFFDAISRFGVSLNFEIEFAFVGGPTALFLSGCSISHCIFIVASENEISPDALRTEVAATNFTGAESVPTPQRLDNVRPMRNGSTSPIRNGKVSVLKSPQKSENSEPPPKKGELEWYPNQAIRALGVAVHGLRNPASGILTACEYLMQEECESFSEKQLNLLRAVAKSASFMLQMIEDTMQVSCSENGQLKLNLRPSDLLCLVKLGLLVNEPQAARMRIGFDLAVEGHTFVLDVDAVKISQVIDNLLQNAIRFSTEGSKIEINIRVGTNSASIAVRDHGAGIPDDRIATIFHPFQESRPGAGMVGTGLGLAISRRIVEAHGGNITVESEVGEGSTFTVNLPTRIASRPHRKLRVLTGERRRAPRTHRRLPLSA